VCILTSKITYELAQWPQQQAEIRLVRTAVFIEEQQVPVELEWDGKDVDSYHWLAIDKGQAVGCCRMQRDGHIGRMAVLENYRGQGIGFNLLKNAINQAKASDLFECYLYAQTHALAFYQKAGFEVHGEEFIDAGINHYAMRLQLCDKRLLGQHGGNFAVKHLSETALDLVQQTTKQLRILSFDLDHSLFDTEEMAEAVSKLARSSRYTDIKIMVIDPMPMVRHGHRLLNLHRRLPSNIALRRCTAEVHDVKNNQIIADQLGIINQTIKSPEKIWANFNNRPVVENNIKLYDDLWERAVVDKNLRQLSI
jgi:predicted GNAT family N-acyltransferase